MERDRRIERERNREKKRGAGHYWNMRGASVIVSSQESLVYTPGSLCRLRYSNGASDKAAAGEEIAHSRETET